MKHSNITHIILIITFLAQFSQAKARNRSNETDSLANVAARVLGAATAEERIEADSLLTVMLTEKLLKETNTGLPLDLPASIAVITSDDKQLRIVNWVVPVNINRYRYKALVQTHLDGITRLFPLNDLSDDKITEKAIHRGDKWFGALYYQIIEKKYNGEKIYTLLGWNRSQEGFQTKLAEAITIDKKSGQPVFGLKIFPRYSPRFLVSYSSRADLSMRYSPQLHTVRKGLFRRLKTVKDEMIVYNRPSANDTRFRNDPRFNYPSGNIFDALIWQHGTWLLLRDVDARNESKPADDTPSPTHLDLFPPGTK